MKRKWLQLSLMLFIPCIVLVALFAKLAISMAWLADRDSIQRTAQISQRQEERLLRSADPTVCAKVRLLNAINQRGVIGKAVAEFREVRRLADNEFGVRDRCSFIWEEALKDVPGQQCTGYHFSFGDIEEFEEGESCGFDVLTVDDKIAFVWVEQLIW